MRLQDARILYAEDDADTRELVTLILEQQDCQVVAAESHDEILRLAQAEHFDLYLIDNWMPGVSGVRLCEQLREFDQDTPVLFYSAAAYEMDRAEALQSGAQAYLIKPSQPSELCDLVTSVIQSHPRAGSVAV